MHLELYFAHASHKDDAAPADNTDALESLELSVRTFNAVARQRINNVSELKKQIEENEEDCINFFGTKAVEEIKEKLYGKHK